VLEPVLLNRPAFDVVFEQDIAGRVALLGGRCDKLLERCRVSIAMLSADDSIVDAREFLEEPVTERAKRDFCADWIDCPAIQSNRPWSASAPSATKRRAVAKPMPLLPPVMRAFLPVSFITSSLMASH